MFVYPVQSNYNKQNSHNKPKPPHAPWDSLDFQRICQEYRTHANEGTMREYKEEYKSLLAIDYFDYTKRIGLGGIPFELSDTLRRWLLNDRVFSVTENYLSCFFNRREIMPTSVHPRRHRRFPSFSNHLIKKKYNKRIYRDAVQELKKIQSTAQQYRRMNDIAHIQEIRLSLYVIYYMVKLYYVAPMSARKLKPATYQALVAVVPNAASMYRSLNGRYVTKERGSFGRVLGAQAAELMLKTHLEAFSNRWASNTPPRY